MSHPNGEQSRQLAHQEVPQIPTGVLPPVLYSGVVEVHKPSATANGVSASATYERAEGRADPLGRTTIIRGGHDQP